MAALALEASPEVGAGSITAEVEGVTFVEVLTVPAGGVKPVTGWTGAPEGPVSVDTMSSPTEILHHVTLVDVLETSAPASAVRTEGVKLLAGVGRTGLAGVSPGLAQGTAAGLPRHVTPVGRQTVAGPVLHVAAGLSPVLTVRPVRGEDPALRTLTLEPALSVMAEALAAEV